MKQPSQSPRRPQYADTRKVTASMTNVVQFPEQYGRDDSVDETSSAGHPAPVSRAVYTVKETADLLSLSLGSTYSLVRTGQIPAIKLGGRWVIPKRRLHQWLDALSEASADDFTAEFQPRTNRRRP